MKMEEVRKGEELLDSEVPPQITQQKTDSQTEEGSLELEAPSVKDGAQDVPDSSSLSSMPCLLMELRRDSSESQLASTESDKPAAGRVYESDSSNHCMLSPSSSGHLADSDTLSSAEENAPRHSEAITEGCDAITQGVNVARKSRRSRSESETSTMAAKKNRQSTDKQNGRVTKIKGHRSQKHKERIRLLRQKREAAARKKYNLLQDSSTSDSDLTCDSSTSSSDEDEEVSGSSKTITAEIPDIMINDELKDNYTRLNHCLGGDGPLVAAHFDVSDTNSDPDVLNVHSMLAATVVKELNSLSSQDNVALCRNRGLLEDLNADSVPLDTGLAPSDKRPNNDKINISSDSEVEIVGVQEHARFVHPRGGVIQSVSSWKQASSNPYHSSHQTSPWTAVAPQPNWTSPADVVDLTLDEDTRRRYLL